MSALARVDEDAEVVDRNDTILARLYALHQESVRDAVAADGLGHHRLTYSALDRPLELSEWHPLSGPAPTD